MGSSGSKETSTRRFALLAPLAHRPFRLLFWGKVVSNLGDWLDILALLTLIVYRWDLGAFGWGAYLIALTLPYAVIGPFAGVWVDRLPRKTVMVACDLARAVVVLGLVWAPNLPAVLLFVTIQTVFSTFFGPAQQATIRATVPPEDLLTANSLSQLADNAARLIGPGIGGLVLVLVGLRGSFIADAATFLISAAFLLRLPRLARLPAPPTVRRRFWPEFRQGVHHIVRRRALLITVGCSVAASFFIRATDTIGAVVLKALGVTTGQLGPSFTLLGLGYVAGALALGQWGKGRTPILIMGLGVLELGSLMAMLGTAAIEGLSGGAVAIFAAFVSRFLLGFGFGALGVVYGTILQRETPDDLMGRVAATSEMLKTTIPLVAPLIVGGLAAWLGLGWAFAIPGGGLMIVGAVVILARDVPVGVTELPSSPQ